MPLFDATDLSWLPHSFPTSEGEQPPVYDHSNWANHNLKPPGTSTWIRLRSFQNHRKQTCSYPVKTVYWRALICSFILSVWCPLNTSEQISRNEFCCSTPFCRTLWWNSLFYNFFLLGFPSALRWLWSLRKSHGTFQSNSLSRKLKKLSPMQRWRNGISLPISSGLWHSILTLSSQLISCTWNWHSSPLQSHMALIARARLQNVRTASTVFVPRSFMILLCHDFLSPALIEASGITAWLCGESGQSRCFEFNQLRLILIWTPACISDHWTFFCEK